MYEKILFPVDEASESSAILHHVSEIAHWSNGEVQLLFVANTDRDSVTLVDNQVVDALVDQGESVVKEAGNTLDTLGVTYGTDVIQGNPAPTIAEYADKYDYDLVVMPTHARQGISRRLLGSITEKVVRLSKRPVLTARMVSTDQLNFPYEHVLIPTDGSESATRAAEHGLELAAETDATVHVLSVIDDSALGPDVRSALSGSEYEQVATTAVETVASRAAELGVSRVVEHLEYGTPSDEISEIIDEYDIDAVVMGTTGKSGIDRILLGSVAEKTVRTAPVPVITVGPRDESSE
ncbi:MULTISPECIES: universal stress protein [Haloferax]|uniref:Universal stress protein n=1 Tax=Haloferax marinum TaxID=2666143 RepID=A0A6A8GB61_9EURY|nr:MULTISPECIES: universal stress protein [Haloferax]KAB1191104.1 universal stress protein [Haloferax sp. CBA1150]MRW97985.1 universal stress protein [Haloferax marinum]